MKQERGCFKLKAKYMEKGDKNGWANRLNNQHFKYIIYIYLSVLCSLTDRQRTDQVR